MSTKKMPAFARYRATVRKNTWHPISEPRLRTWHPPPEGGTLFRIPCRHLSSKMWASHVICKFLGIFEHDLSFQEHGIISRSGYGMVRLNFSPKVYLGCVIYYIQ